MSIPLLFVAENVTLAQVVRLVRLARSLDPARYEVHFACADFPDLAFAGTGFIRHAIASLAPEKAADALERGRRLYEERTLRSYVDAEIALIERVRPALVIGDFRLSLSTSAELCRVPSAVLINAYWSPFARRKGFPVPDHPIIGWLGEERTERYFPQAMPWVFSHFAAPLNAVRRRHGLAPVGSLLESLTHADHTLYPDDPELTPVDGAPPAHRFIGPVLWEPDVAEPDEGAELDFAEAQRALPLVYVTLGSSGQLAVMPALLDALGSLPVRALIATAGRASLGTLPRNLVARSFVRGSALARAARCVISNGGSTTGYQALAQGTPVLGIPSNLDQYLATEAIVNAGAGTLVKARSATRDVLREAIVRTLEDASLRRAARVIAERFARLRSDALFGAWLEAVVGP